MYALDRESKAAKDKRVLSWLGNTFVSNGVNALAQKNSDKLELTKLFYRHALGDWGELLEGADKKLNDDMLVLGGRVLSAYLFLGEKIWIITEADRTRTTALLPSEY